MRGDRVPSFRGREELQFGLSRHTPSSHRPPQFQRPNSVRRRTGLRSTKVVLSVHNSLRDSCVRSLRHSKPLLDSLRPLGSPSCPKDPLSPPSRPHDHGAAVLQKLPRVDGECRSELRDAARRFRVDGADEVGSPGVTSAPLETVSRRDGRSNLSLPRLGSNVTTFCPRL